MGEAMTRWRLIGLAGCVTVVVAVACAVVLLGGGDDSHAVPEGGSSFGAGAPRTVGRAAGLLDALAPGLDQGGPGDASPAAPASSAAPADPGGTVTTQGARAGLPGSEARAAARLFRVGFGGSRAPHDLLE